VRLVREPFSGRDSLEYAISDDGEWIAYRSASDPKVAVVVPAPRFPKQ
jgi:hypothetical protein